MTSSHPPPGLPPLSRSSYALGLAAFAAVGVILATYSSSGAAAGNALADPALCAMARSWRAKYPPSDDLQVAATRVTFRGIPGQFVQGQALVVAPVALALPGSQEVLEIDGDPKPLRVLPIEGTSALAWEYPGALTRDVQVEGFALVRRSVARAIPPPVGPAFETLAQDSKLDAMLTGSMLRDHHVVNCKAFLPWVRATAGDPPYTDQLLRIAGHLASRSRPAEPERDKKKGEDVCAALRGDRFTDHQAQVAAVLAGRELGAPTVGVFRSELGRHVVVATYVDGPGWIELDLAEPSPGYTAGGSALVAMAPIVGQFEASRDEGWDPAGSAYQQQPFGVVPISHTRRGPESLDHDTTSSWSMPLQDICP